MDFDGFTAYLYRKKNISLVVPKIPTRVKFTHLEDQNPQSAENRP